MASVTRNPRPLFVTALPAGYDGQEVFYQSTTAGTGGGSTDTEAASDDATEVDAASKVVQVAMTDNVFTLSESTAKVGQEIEFVVVNNGAAVHNMVFDGTEFASESMINPGDTSSFKATFTEAGVYKFICVFHMPAMVGEITVED